MENQAKLIQGDRSQGSDDVWGGKWGAAAGRRQEGASWV